ncbi:MAG: ATP-dependent Clp protease proteolytic subunit [Clostridiales bacterium]|jgi:ATP-dependent Clp protease protease subunit|nr:ATP-dependent Clp protease proteolytic subunit [Clostridiales bacterium]
MDSKKPEEIKEENKEEKLIEKLLKTRSIIICGEINQALAEKVTTQLLLLQAMGDDPINLYLNSQGGHVEAGDTIHDMIQFIRPRVLIVGTGWVASAGITIYLAASRVDRYSLPNTRYMIHQPLGGAQGQATDLKIEADEIIKMRERINRLISHATGQPVEKVHQDTLRNHWMDVHQAIEYGIVNRIVTRFDEVV